MVLRMAGALLLTFIAASSSSPSSSRTIQPGGQFSHTFPGAGSFTYHWAFHPNMVTRVTVQ